MCPTPSRPSIGHHDVVVVPPAVPQRPSNRAERRHPELRVVSLAATARYFQVSEATPRHWVRRGYVTGFVDSKQALFLDLDEVEAALTSNPRMRDGRRSRYGADARILPLPTQAVRAEVVAPTEGGDS